MELENLNKMSVRLQWELLALRQYRYMKGIKVMTSWGTLKLIEGEIKLDSMMLCKYNYLLDESLAVNPLLRTTSVCSKQLVIVRCSPHDNAS